MEEELRIQARDLDRLIEWMRRSSRPQTIEGFVRLWLQRLQEEAQRNR